MCAALPTRIPTLLPALSPALVPALLVALLLAAPPAHAGRAQAGLGMATWADWDLAAAQVDGSAWRDGTLVQTATSTGVPGGNDAASAQLSVFDAAASARIAMQGSGTLRGPAGAADLPFSGQALADSSLVAGRLQLALSNDHVRYATAAGNSRQAFATAYPFAELFETFEVWYPIGRVDPVQVSLQMRIDGSLTGNTGDNGWISGVQAYLQLSNVATGDNHFFLDPVWRSEAAVAGQTLGYAGDLAAGGCSVATGLCNSFFGVYAGLDLRSRAVAGGPADNILAGAPLALDVQAGLALQVSDGVTLVRIGGSNDPLPPVAWATVGAVPEPGAWALMVAGLGLLAFRRRP